MFRGASKRFMAAPLQATEDFKRQLETATRVHAIWG